MAWLCGTFARIKDIAHRVWNEAELSIIAIPRLVAMFIVVYGFILLCDLLFVNYDIYVEVNFNIVDILLSLHLTIQLKKSVKSA